VKDNENNGEFSKPHKRDIDYYIEVEYEEEILLEGDFVFKMTFEGNLYLQFWLNANFIPQFLFKRSKQEFVLVPEAFDSSLMTYSSFNIFSEKLKTHTFNGNSKYEAAKELRPLIFKQETLKIHSECLRFLKKIYENMRKKDANKKAMISCHIQLISLKDLDKNRSLKKQKYLKENFSINLVFF